MVICKCVVECLGMPYALADLTERRGNLNLGMRLFWSLKKLKQRLLTPLKQRAHLNDMAFSHKLEREYDMTFGQKIQVLFFFFQMNWTQYTHCVGRHTSSSKIHP